MTSSRLAGPLRSAGAYLSRQGLFRRGLSKRCPEPHLDGRVDENERLWPLLMFQLWHLLYVQERSTEAPSAAIRSVIS